MSRFLSGTKTVKTVIEKKSRNRHFQLLILQPFKLQVARKCEKETLVWNFFFFFKKVRVR